MAVMTPEAQRQGLAALLATVPGIGIIHQRKRLIRTEAAIKEICCPPATPTKVNCWMISPAAATVTTTERNPGHHGIGQKGGGNNFTTFQWQIEGYYQLDDSDAGKSEVAFFDLAWAVANEFNAYGKLNIVGLVQQLPTDIEQFGYIFLAGVQFVHYVRINIPLRGSITA
jgi:hypothetical protein